MPAATKSPAIPLIGAVLAGPIPGTLPALAIGLGAPGWEGALRLWGMLALFGAAFALVIGVPIALWLLRDPAAPLRRWIAAAGLAAAICAATVTGWFALGGGRPLGLPHGTLAIVALWTALLTLSSATASRLILRSCSRSGR